MKSLKTFQEKINSFYLNLGIAGIVVVTILSQLSCVNNARKNDQRFYSKQESEAGERNKIFETSKISENEYNNFFNSNPNLPYVIKVAQNGLKIGYISSRNTYDHIITIGLRCGPEDNFISSTLMSYKTIEWKISDEIKGHSTTDIDGYFKVFFNDDKNQPYKKIYIYYKNREYLINLPNYKKTNISEAECFN